MPCYQRVLLKLSGEALAGIDPLAACEKPLTASILSNTKLIQLAKDIAKVVAQSVQLGIVIGGGNWWRGEESNSVGLNRVTADQVGMLATLMNALALRDILMQQGLAVRIMSVGTTASSTEPFDSVQAKQYLSQGTVIIFSGGTGHPFVSTDSAASLRALEIEADILLKATSVDGIYSKDPLHHPEATLHRHLSYAEVITQELAVMDLAAFIQCRDYCMPIKVFNIHHSNALLKVMQGNPIGTLVDRKLNK